MPKKTVTETRNTGPQYRFFSLDREAINAEARTVDIAFSSEQPADRWFGKEILDHAPSAIRLGRLKDGGALLLDHDMSRHIGVVESVEVGTDRVGRAVVRFGKSADAETVFQDVRDGIRRHVSVGYFVHRMVREESSENGKDERYRVVDWEPLEISFVAVPWDPTVGVGRSATDAQVSTAIEREVEEPEADPNPASIQVIKEQRSMDTKQKEPAELERERTAGIATLGEQYAQYVSTKDTAEAIRNGRSVEQFKDLVLTKMETRHTDTSALHIGMSKKEAQSYSLGRAIRAMVTGKWDDAGFERECSEAVSRIVGATPEGIYVPYDIFRRDFNVGTASEAGNLVATDMRTDLYVDALRNAMVFARMGVRMLPGLTANIDIPRKATASTIGMLTEIGSAAETAPATAKLTLSPKRMGAYVEYSKQALIQSAIPLEAMLRDDLLMSAGVLLEDQCLNGVGTGANIRGIRNTTGIGTSTAGANGATVAWSHLVDLESACANSNAEPDTLAGYVTNTRVRGRTKQVQRGTNLPFIWDNGAQPLNGYRAAITNNIPNNLTKGTSTTICSAALFSSDWSMFVVGLFGAPDITVDPYTKADTGQVKITLNQFADGGARQPAAFSKIEDLLT